MLISTLFIILLALSASVNADYYSFDDMITLKQDSFDTTSWVSLVFSAPGTLNYNVTCLDGSSRISVMILDKRNLDRYLSGMTYNHYSAYSSMMVTVAVMNDTIIDIDTDLYLVIENMNLFSSVTVYATTLFVGVSSPESNNGFYLPPGVVAGLVILIVVLVAVVAISIFIIAKKKRGYTKIESDSSTVLEVAKEEQSTMMY